MSRFKEKLEIIFFRLSISFYSDFPSNTYTFVWSVKSAPLKPTAKLLLESLDLDVSKDIW